MKHLVWKTRHKAGEHPDYFSFSIKREDFPALPLTADQFSMLFPRVNKDDVPEAPESAVIKIEGLVL